MKRSIRTVYADGAYTGAGQDARLAEFDRMIAEVERAAAARALEEAGATLERVRALIVRAGTYGPDEFGAFKRDLALAALAPVTEEGDKE